MNKTNDTKKFLHIGIGMPSLTFQLNDPLRKVIIYKASPPTGIQLKSSAEREKR